ncbi:hypothetical protein MAF45_10870 [Mesosutterella sp. OilRF-GAM-744-9]|uniref:Uncharacterized protein n=1 Tax=Mesosutterella porci TaxID=2915351 RepID=A0ABS9MTJ2_9BURK|nr:hypothetical protein [Mesosutterella sp. oilRF-744-WT-GAM-9]MCG5031936.1 hypothetical protein [Mesosutterella sp. oilRF-744-WT-GAM-9]
MTTIRLSGKEKGRFGIVGHAGVGHVHSHSGFVQDDSAGFAAAARILKEALPADTRIARAYADQARGLVTVETESGGRGCASTSRGITPAEQELLERSIGLDAALPQNAAVHTFGRVYGQGALPLPSAFEGACALAALDSFGRAGGGSFLLSPVSPPPNYDRCGGTVIELDGLPVSLLLVVNGTRGGLGPDEDLEGNVCEGVKKDLMERLGLNRIPTVVVESKAYAPAAARDLKENRYLVRVQKNLDCGELGQALLRAGQSLGLPIFLADDAMPLEPGALRKATRRVGEQIVRLGQEFMNAESAAEKVSIIARLNRLASEDAGGVTFMSNAVHDRMRGAGTLPGISALLSMNVTSDYIRQAVIPTLTQEDLEGYRAIIVKALEALGSETGRS